MSPDDYAVKQNIFRVETVNLDNARKEHRPKDLVSTPLGELERTKWIELAKQAITEAGETELLNCIKTYCKANCAWLKRTEDLEEYAVRILCNRVYLHWKDFEPPQDQQGIIFIG